MTEGRPRIDRIAEKILGVIGFIVAGVLIVIGAAMLAYGLYVPMFVATAPLFLGTVIIAAGIIIMWAIWRHFTKGGQGK